jgi:hypothetical protein
VSACIGLYVGGVPGGFTESRILRPWQALRRRLFFHGFQGTQGPPLPPSHSPMLQPPITLGSSGAALPHCRRRGRRGRLLPRRPRHRSIGRLGPGKHHHHKHKSGASSRSDRDDDSVGIPRHTGKSSSDGPNAAYRSVARPPFGPGHGGAYNHGGDDRRIGARV